MSAGPHSRRIAGRTWSIRRVTARAALCAGLCSTAFAGNPPEPAALAAEDPRHYERSCRMLQQERRTGDAIQSCEEWVAQRPDDAAAWFHLGQARQQARRYAEAAHAYGQSLMLEPSPRARSRMEAATFQSAPSVKPYAALADDSDENEITRAGVEAQLQLSSRSRWGLRAEHQQNVSAGGAEGHVDSVALTASWQPLATLRFDAHAGVARLDADDNPDEPSQHPQLGLRVRGAFPGEGPSGELRITRSPLTSSTALLTDAVELLRADGMVEVPLAGAVRVRARGQAGRLTSALHPQNERTSYSLGPVLRLNSAELSASYGELAYESPTAAAYFAPERVESMELATYVEYEGFWPLTLALDAGVGRQRVTRYDTPAGEWGGSLRIWTLVAWEISHGIRLELEGDYSDSQVPENATAANDEWRSTSVLLSLRFGMPSRSARALMARHSQ